ncbi:hypothetical protein XaCFBP7622_14830 [Xanthomonas arboricola]|nr:hypothetical protein XaCFBP7622_14830 [Xanthomonas arboricola]
MRMPTTKTPLAAAIDAGVRHAEFLDANGGVWAQERRREPARRIAAADQRRLTLRIKGASCGYETLPAMPLNVPGLPPAIAIAAGRDCSAAVDRRG